jgi:hypothetical protein
MHRVCQTGCISLNGHWNELHNEHGREEIFRVGIRQKENRFQAQLLSAARTFPDIVHAMQGRFLGKLSLPTCKLLTDC